MVPPVEGKPPPPVATNCVTGSYILKFTPLAIYFLVKKPSNNLLMF
jgi:hypothetical protein